MLIQQREQGKIDWSQVRRVWGMFQCGHAVIFWEILDLNRPVCWSIIVQEKPAFGSKVFWAFPFDRICKATNDVSVHIFIYSYYITEAKIITNSTYL
jgi:hypothetical protein